MQKRNHTITKAFFQRKMKKENQWKQILDRFEDGFLILKKDFTILYQNSAFTNIFTAKKETNPINFMSQDSINQKGKILVKSFKLYRNLSTLEQKSEDYLSKISSDKFQK